MIRGILSFCIGATVLAACSSNTPEIHTVCIRDRIGNYQIKWETNPPIEGMVKIYVSDNPDKFGKKEPVIHTNINQGIATYITTDNISRKYFRLTFNDKHSQVVGAKSVAMDSVQNFRDMGGYFNKRHKMIRWGKVYRSGDISHLSTIDSLRLNKLNIKTIIDLRSPYEIASDPIRLTGPNIVKIPLTAGNLADIEPFLREGKIRKGDAIVLMQDLYLRFISENSEAFSQALHLFLNKENYPILFSCTLGKDGTGYLAALLLAALSVSEDTILQDYLFSNDYIMINRYAPLARTLTPDAQEAITVLLSANKTFLSPVLQKIRRDYGTINHFLETAVGFSEKDRDKLKDILLY